MRSIWKGAISFGLVTIPVKLYGATQEKDVTFHQVHRSDGGRIRYKRVCEVDGEEVAYGDIAKGFDLGTGETVVLTDDDLADLPLPTQRVIDVLAFVPLAQLDPVYFAKSYYLEPEKAGTKPYVLLRQALEDSERVAIVKVALRQRESLAALRVRGGVFVLETMLWPDEVRTPEFDFLDDEVAVRPQELAMATSLIESLSGDFDPSQYSDDYRAALQSVIDAKIEGHQVLTPDAPEGGGGGAVLDLMAALRASVDAAKAGRGTGAPAGPEAGVSADPSAPAKKAKRAEVRGGPSTSEEGSSGRSAAATRCPSGRSRVAPTPP